MKPTTSEYIVVRKSSIHNKGVFAKKDIRKGTKVIEYVGEKLTKAQSETRADEILDTSKKDKSKGGVYIFELNKRYDIDGSVSWNTAKWINHSCDPNCETDILKGKIWIIAIKKIKKGEEITYNYAYDVDEEFDDHPCKCGTKPCPGYIADDDQWPKLKRLIKKKKLKRH